MSEKVFRGYRMRWVQFMPGDHFKGDCKYPNCESLQRERNEFSHGHTTTRWKDREEVQRLVDNANEYEGSRYFYHAVEEVWRTKKIQE